MSAKTCRLKSFSPISSNKDDGIILAIYKDNPKSLVEIKGYLKLQILINQLN
jgi:hypothetical protein